MDAYEGKDPYIFISYSHKDSAQMLRLVSELKKYCNVWYDSGIHAGNDWADKVADKLFNCSLFLFLVSPNSLASDNCKDELALARDSGKPFINIRLSDISFEGGMQLRYGRYQYFDLFKYDDYSKAVVELFKSESFGTLGNTQIAVNKLAEQVKTMMSTPEEAAHSLNEQNADLMMQFRTVNTSIEFGRYMNQPIVWDIKSVDKDVALLVSKDIIESKSFNSYQASYDESELRDWLNNVFLSAAFNEEEKAMLYPLCSVAGQNTSDRIGLLSYEQAIELYKSDAERTKSGTSIASNHGLIANSAGAGWWWLSTLDKSNSDFVYRVYSNGRIGFDTDFDNDCIGVVPIIVVRIA